MKDRWIFPCHVYRSNSAANRNAEGPRASVGACLLAPPSFRRSPGSLEVRQPGPHVAGAHVAAVFTNTVPGFPRALCDGPEGATLQDLAAACASPFVTHGCSHWRQSQQKAELTEPASVLGFARFTFKRYSARGLEQGRPR